MASNGKKIWFPAKRYGWGWGLPVTWQGWVALLLYMLGVAASAWLLPPHDAPFAFSSCVAVLSAALVVVCWLRGEKPRWRWGKDD
ncbi:hypothetical protein [Burkholderia ubonensis]|uniref:hypothetical protein n=1 Tax=Burkholderia ubonensis TaxID=101571 RepID=UPI0007520AD0|nr:hypothetical protein [Burkholderia ubonensis]KVN59329.1 hypothetical protein WJ65_22625 [Burkholderia ubonensis]KVR03299.1 hypothetical protein WK10_04900 [Burkholderia ubonensis]KVT54740.1 hypothetical protein WK55_19670 [Burkholderia ubonensis]KVZ36461.1 hypothetical protein WL17_20490 [Burkholderia ubonensis]KWI11333.1 hypothetical protein WM02_17820 [Burkholderia ubonensis]